MKQINARLPDETHAALKVMAEEDHRSLNAMLIFLVEEEQKRRSIPACGFAAGTSNSTH